MTVEIAAMMVVMKTREMALMVVAAVRVTTVMQGRGRGVGIGDGDGRGCKPITTVLRGKGPGAREVESWRILIQNSWKENLYHN